MNAPGASPESAPELPALPALSAAFGAMPTEPLREFMQWMATSPEFSKLYFRFLGDSAALWRACIEREAGKPFTPPAVPGADDRRFASPEWTGSPYFDFLRQYYLIYAGFVNDSVEAASLPAHEKGQLRFFARQYIDAVSPANFAATNPEALKAALATNGETLRQGIEQFVHDAARGRISTVDESAFEIGRNIAITPGAVVYQNALIQLIQYAPSTPTVHRRPLLMVPPCINKFYILDLSPENSFVRYAVEQGHTVFMVSWRNPAQESPPPAGGAARRRRPPAGDRLDRATWDDYVEKGAMAAIRAAQEISGEPLINALGFCVGGTILSSALAVLAARGERPAASLTLLATLLDFSDTGEIGLFIDEKSVEAREAMLGGGGLLAGSELARVFSALRDNDLIWSYVVNNYLKGRKPAAFDILYWNADSTNLPGPMYAWYLRNMYLENALRDPGRLKICGEKVDLGAIGLPSYVVGTREDHIVPWKSAYQSVHLLAGRGRGRSAGPPGRFVLGASGHIAGIINPAAKNRRSYWLGGETPASAEGWLAKAKEHPGSWWGNWNAWLAPLGGDSRPAPVSLGSAAHPVLEPAPGSYVKVRVD